ncbi:MAG: hypothetical protein IT380_00335 [Myxococcales bacterium]|nr:hypothetical protein [Myxococcales bacterium]
MRLASLARLDFLAPLDAVRSALYRALAPWLRGLYADRPRRVAWMGALSVGTSFALVLAAPLWVLALGPVLLGVPHLVADLRYLVVKPGLHRHFVPASLAAACLVAVGFGAPSVVGLFAMVPAVLAARADGWKKGLALGVWLVLSVCAWRDEYAFLLAFLHAHNLLALALWWRVRPRDGRAAVTVLLVLAGAAALLFGLGDGVIAALGGFSSPGTGTDFTELVASIAPDVEPTLALHLVLSFAFLQSVHYALWVRLIPEDARERPAPRTFRASLQALAQDFGRPLLALACLVALGIAVWGAFDLPGARWGYLRLATFHGYLELAAGAWLWLEGRRPALRPEVAR